MSFMKGQSTRTPKDKCNHIIKHDSTGKTKKRDTVCRIHVHYDGNVTKNIWINRNWLVQE